MEYLLILLAVIMFQDVPLKPKEEFEIKLEYEFKQRPGASNAQVNFEKNDTRDAQAILPFLAVNVNILSAHGATRMKISNNRDGSIGSKKVKDGSQYHLVFGFTDDVKDRVTAHEYTMLFTGDDKREISRIVMSIEEDGTFLVNNEKRGRF